MELIFPSECEHILYAWIEQQGVFEIQNKKTNKRYNNYTRGR